MLVLVIVGAVMIFMNVKEYYSVNPRKKRFKGDDTNPSIGIVP
jgi:hypothetical protein